MPKPSTIILGRDINDVPSVLMSPTTQRLLLEVLDDMNHRVEQLEARLLGTFPLAVSVPGMPKPGDPQALAGETVLNWDGAVAAMLAGKTVQSRTRNRRSLRMHRYDLVIIRADSPTGMDAAAIGVEDFNDTWKVVRRG